VDFGGMMVLVECRFIPGAIPRGNPLTTHRSKEMVLLVQKEQAMPVKVTSWEQD